MPIITIACPRGGCGKTTIAITLSYYFSRTASTLLVDLDGNPQASRCLNVEEESHGVQRWLNRHKDPDEYDWNFHIVAGGQSRIIATTEQLTRRIQEHGATYTILDTTPSPHSITLQAIDIADIIIIPIGPDPHTLESAQTLLVRIHEQRRQAIVIFALTQFNSNLAWHRSLFESIRNLDIHANAFTIRRSGHIGRLQNWILRAFEVGPTPNPAYSDIVVIGDHITRLREVDRQ